MAVELVNTLNPVSGEDRLGDVAGLREFVARYEDDWTELADHCRELSERDLKEVHDLRRRLREVFEAGGEEDAVEAVNSLLADSHASPRISLHGADPHLHVEPTRGRVAEWLGSATAMGLGVVLVDHGVARFGVCSSGDCDDVYVDTSRNRSRIHCSTSCTTRENVAAYRRRQRAAAD